MKGAPKNADPVMLDDVGARPDFSKRTKQTPCCWEIFKSYLKKNKLVRPNVIEVKYILPIKIANAKNNDHLLTNLIQFICKNIPYDFSSKAHYSFLVAASD